MPAFSPEALSRSLDASWAGAVTPAFCVAYSGGLDSTVLLHSLVHLARQRSGLQLRAVHINHQLQPDAGRWQEHCAAVARTLQVAFLPLRVEVGQHPGGLEAAARQARYEALRGLLARGETLLTAHHADDQLETVLLALMRGAGLRGLGAMHPLQPFGPGWLARPLLEFTRAELERWATQSQLSWITDTSNEDTARDRNYLRHQVVPALRCRWPAVARSAGRSAQHLGEAGRLIETLAAQDAAPLAVGDCLSVPGLMALEPARRRGVLRHWFRQRGVRAPSTRKLAAIEHDMLRAREDRLPCVDWDGVQVRRHRGFLYCLQQLQQLPCGAAFQWQTDGSLQLPAQLGRLRMVPAPAGLALRRLAPSIEVRFRDGGELFQPQGDAHHRKLKKLLQSCQVLPWWRDRLPLIYSAGELVAVADLWVAQSFAASAAEPAVRVLWEGKPQITACGS